MKSDRNNGRELNWVDALNTLFIVCMHTLKCEATTIFFFLFPILLINVQSVGKIPEKSLDRFKAENALGYIHQAIKASFGIQTKSNRSHQKQISKTLYVLQNVFFFFQIMLEPFCLQRNGNICYLEQQIFSVSLMKSSQNIPCFKVYPYSRWKPTDSHCESVSVLVIWFTHEANLLHLVKSICAGFYCR